MWRRRSLFDLPQDSFATTQENKQLGHAGIFWILQLLAVFRRRGASTLRCCCIVANSQGTEILGQGTSRWASLGRA